MASWVQPPVAPFIYHLDGGSSVAAAEIARVEVTATGKRLVGIAVKASGPTTVVFTYTDDTTTSMAVSGSAAVTFGNDGGCHTYSSTFTTYLRNSAKDVKSVHVDAGGSFLAQATIAASEVPE